MRAPIRLVGFTLLFAAVLEAPAQSDEPQKSHAIKVTVVSPEGESLSGDDCKLHFVDRDGDHAILGPCGDWFVLPRPGWYRFWAEYASAERQLISPFQPAMYFAGVSLNEKGSESRITVSSASRIQSPRRLESGETFRIAVETESQNLFTRSSSSQSRMLIPTGNGVAGIFNDAGEAIALTQSFAIDPNAHFRTAIRHPREDRGHVLAIVRSNDSHSLDQTLYLEGHDANHSPDVMLTSRGNTRIAVWYDIPHGRLHLRGSILERGEPIRIRAGRITTVRRQ